MPYKDKDKANENARRWREKKMPQGYGKALYARRAQRLRNEVIFREAVEQALFEIAIGNPEIAAVTLGNALKAAPPIGKPLDYMPNMRINDASS